MSPRATSARAMRRLLCTLPAVLAAAALTATVADAATGLAVSEGAGATFPARSLVLSVPGQAALTPAQVHVSESGVSVGKEVVTPIASAGAGDFGVVLAIDVSPSMRGQALENALSAARALAAQRSGQQQLGVLAFAQTPEVILPLSTDEQAIHNTLANTLQIRAGTHIYDALSSALQQLAAAHVAAGSVILLSDGADRGSSTPEATVAAAARAAHISLYTIGVRDATFNPTSLTMLARDGGGQYLEASASQLRKVFTSLETGLTSRFVVHYRSPAPLGQHVQVSVTVSGVAQPATLTYDSPAPRPTPGRHARHVKAKSFWVSTLALVVFAFAAALVLGFGVMVFLVPHLRREGLQRRVGEFTRDAAPAGAEQSPGAAPRVHAPSLTRIERLLEQTEWWGRFKADVEVARVKRTPVELVTIAALGTAAVALAFGLWVSPWIAILPLLLGPLALRSGVRYRLHRQCQLFADQLPAHLQEVASAMRAGHSLVGSIASMAADAPEPSHSEWTQVVADEKLGVPLDEALRPLIARMQSDDVGQVALVAALHQQTGGNMAEVLERVADGARERGELRRELRALTAQARLSRYVVTALPPVVLVAVALLNPHYIRPLFHTTTGLVLVFIASGLLVGASLVMRAITDVKV
jgi:tight adherence protein B